MQVSLQNDGPVTFLVAGLAIYLWKKTPFYVKTRELFSVKFLTILFTRNTTMSLQAIIEAAFERRAEITPKTVDAENACSQLKR